ncbi:MAG: hypothetical protein LBN26_02480 [Christensenellaceae bacterium]|jgi:2-iminobutanoate/2-iminopropanoate deaminase|nr:hypothetical protein [Christensenellaceae bacterium]
MKKIVSATSAPAAVNRVYGKTFSGDFPARSCVQAAKLPANGLVKIELIAAL